MGLKKPVISVIIPAFNEEKLITDCLDTVRRIDKQGWIKVLLFQIICSLKMLLQKNPIITAEDIR